jgi:hypothetical protein
MLTVNELHQAASDLEAFKSLIKDSEALESTIILYKRKYTDETAQLIKILLSNPVEYKRLVDSLSILLFIKIHFPEHAQTLIKILQNPNEFRRLIKDTRQWLALDKALDGNNFIPIIAAHLDLFARLIPNVWRLSDFVEGYPSHAEKIMHTFLGHKREFERLVTNDEDLNMASEITGYENILEQPSREKAIEVLKSTAEVNKAAQFISQSLRSSQSIFRILPHELIVKITASAKNSHAHTQEEAENIAREKLCRLSNFKK